MRVFLLAFAFSYGLATTAAPEGACTQELYDVTAALLDGKLDFNDVKQGTEAVLACGALFFKNRGLPDWENFKNLFVFATPAAEQAGKATAQAAATAHAAAQAAGTATATAQEGAKTMAQAAATEGLKKVNDGGAFSEGGWMMMKGALPVMACWLPPPVGWVTCTGAGAYFAVSYAQSMVENSRNFFNWATSP